MGGILLSEFHNNGIGGSTNDIDQTYTPDFGGTRSQATGSCAYVTAREQTPAP